MVWCKIIPQDERNLFSFSVIESQDLEHINLKETSAQHDLSRLSYLTKDKNYSLTHYSF